MEAPALDGDGSARHSDLALPGIFGLQWLFAIQHWHCQRFLAPAAQKPLSVGTTNVFWRIRPARHSVLARQGFLARWRIFLALPMLSGADAPNATQSWHCQGDPTNKKRSYSRPFRRISLMHELYLRVLNRFAASLANDDSCRASQYVHGPCQ